MAKVEQIVNNVTGAMENINSTFNSIANYTMKGSDDRQHGLMGLIMGPVYSLLWKDLTVFVDSMLGINIGDYCDFNKRNYGYMTRLMLINLWEKQTTLSILGDNAMNFGDGNSISTPAQKPAYTQGNYYGDFVNEIHSNPDGVDSTRATYARNEKTNPYREYYNLYPDELDKFSGELSDLDKWDTQNPNSILYKTKQLFNQRKINTIISRFGTNADDDSSKLTYGGQVRTDYGESHGRNLLKKGAEENRSSYTQNGYNNPYCRVWTHHHQYDKYSKVIRPFVFQDANGDPTGNFVAPKEFHKWKDADWANGNNGEYAWKNSDSTGWDKSVLKDGILNIAPKYVNGGASNVHTKDCMFSIENLAWKDYDPYSFEQALSWEQRGPMGGRIMWFPPYGITFQETTTANWNRNTFIGRGEDVFTYTNTQRQGTLRFIMLTDHPSVLDYVSWHEEGQENVKDTDVLRFLAGCDSGDANDENSILSHAKPTPLTDEYTQIWPKDTRIIKADKIPVPEVPPQSVEEVNFAVFYPNNYSGMYDNNDDEYPIKYLLAGLNSGQDLQGNREEITLGEGNGRGYEMGDSGITDEASATADSKTTYIVGNKYAWYQGCKKPYERDEKKHWFYRIDGEYKVPTQKGYSKQSIYANTYAQTLVTKSDYTDSKSYKLNSSLTNSKDLFKDVKEETVYTFTEVVEAIGKVWNYEEYVNYTHQFNSNSERVDKLAQLFSEAMDKSEDKSKLKLTDCTCDGMSNAQGANSSNETNRERNKILAEERGKTIQRWLKLFFKNEKISFGKSIADLGPEYKNSGVSELGPKLYRSAKVKMTFKNEVQEPAKSEYDDYVGYHKTNELVNGKKVYKDSQDPPQKWIEIEEGKFIKYDNTAATIQSRVKNGDYSFNLTNVDDGVNDKEGASENNIYRFDQEYHFFKKLETDKPFIYDSLMKKLQYFDPAFHSMTPEGFNARLTFLHQCTRQGATVANSDRMGGAAGNLAFGRPPFCVLRLGDFYNQMIVIDSISLNYDVSGGITWDMNEEGIGVQPMICEVNINFTFIGGSDMTGPVRRLQNAATFNYYANARLYDNRADRISYGYTNWMTMGGAGNNEIDKNASYYYGGSMYKDEDTRRAERIAAAEEKVGMMNKMNREIKYWEDKQAGKPTFPFVP